MILQWKLPQKVNLKYLQMEYKMLLRVLLETPLQLLVHHLQ